MSRNHDFPVLSLSQLFTNLKVFFFRALVFLISWCHSLERKRLVLLYVILFSLSRQLVNIVCHLSIRLRE